jgi:hypothetical protein
MHRTSVSDNGRNSSTSGGGTWFTATVALLAVLALVAAAACGPGGAGASGQDTVTIPTSDGSSPSIAMDAHFNVEQRPFISVTHGSSPQQASAKPGEVVTFIANGSDPDGGVKTVQIMADVTTCSPPDTDGSVSCSGPGLSGQPIAENRDPDQTRKPGDTAAKSRLVTFNLSVPGGSGSFEAKVSAVVENFSGERKTTPQVTITRP